MQLDLRTRTESPSRSPSRSPSGSVDAVEADASVHGRSRRRLAWIVNGVLVCALLLTSVAVVGSVVGWWRAEAVLSASMQPAIHAGDLEILGSESATDITVGQVIAFHPPHQSITVTHRVVAVDKAEDGVWITTKGDANVAADPWGRIRVSGSRVWVVREVVPKVGSFDVLLKQPAIHLLLLVGVVILGMAVALDAIWRS